MRDDVFVYISGPITAKDGRSIEQNVADALVPYLALLRLGIPAFCPHLSGAFPSAFEIDYETWIAYDYAVIRRCSHLLMLPRWRASSGAVREHDYAARLNLPIAYSVSDLVFQLEPLVKK